ncbi:DUF2382 domain-containing protein [Pontibacter qinzhouensis]|uniref:DUF2382 domain-containing protein n=1 Tax=Pontibacter qinzhouensis TaxID=2603253 RepID=A0A5C8KA57_9BACT|nr:PRC and DUF2382 domain-containing protein [Pontibacter qinzhouensis]TXK49824.1 DUF2382 domain-containing protein [Pontibacter qinzhouensis]
MNENEKLNNNNQLIELGGSDYEIVDGQPDIRGWKVKNAQDETIGEVDELIFDPSALKVRYIVLDLEGNVFDLEPRDVIVPIGAAELHESDDLVYLSQVTADQLQTLPEYRRGSLDRDHELQVRNIFGGLGAAGVAGAAATTSLQDTDYNYDEEFFNEDNLYRRRQPGTPPVTDTTDISDTGTGSIPIIEEDLQVGKRTIETGGARIRSKITERPVEEDITLREESVYVNREPVNRPASESDLDTFKEGEIEITEHTEVPVVSKEANVVEEVTIRKEVEEHEETIRDTVHKTDVEITELTPNNPDRPADLDDDTYLDDEARRRNRLDSDRDEPVI